MGVFVLVIGCINSLVAAQKLINGLLDSIVLLVIMLLMVVIGGLLVWGKRIAVWIAAFIGSCATGLAIWMPMVVRYNDGDWSIYGDYAPVFHALVAFVGIYFKNQRLD
jgi:hypothetical protein